MGKVYRQDRKTVQRIKARDIVPGDIVEIAGRLNCGTKWNVKRFRCCLIYLFLTWTKETPGISCYQKIGADRSMSWKSEEIEVFFLEFKKIDLFCEPSSSSIFP